MVFQLQFPDRLVSYDTFMADLSNRIAERIVAIKQEPEVISQRMAYRQYGRANVQRWVRQNKVHPCKRVGMMEYTTAELRKAQSNQQDYFNKHEKEGIEVNTQKKMVQSHCNWCQARRIS